MYCIRTANEKQFEINIPTSKSITHRILILSSLNSGNTIISNALKSRDTEITQAVLENMGGKFENNNNEEIVSKSCIGKVKNEECFLGNSGSSARFLLPLASFVDKKIYFFGDQKLHERPFSEILNVLQKLGGKIESTNDTLPVTFSPGELNGGNVIFDSLPSSQIITSLMMSALWMKNDIKIELSEITPSLPYINMTYNLMKKLGLNLEISENQIWVKADKPDFNWNFKVEKDLSSASYWVILGLINSKKVILPGITLPSLQGDERIFEIAQLAGANVMLYDDKVEVEGEVENGFDVDCRDIPDLVPALSILGLFAPSPVTLRNVKHLEYKESNRIEAICKNINTLGGKTDYINEQLIIYPQRKYKGGIVNTFNDHRIAMSFAVAGSKIDNVYIDNPGCVKKSYPEFWEHFTYWDQT